MMVERLLGDGVEGTLPPFRMLQDPNHSVVDRYGLFNEEGSRPDRPLPHPTTLVIDREGIVRWKAVETDYRLRPTNEDIIAAVRYARGEGPEPAAPTMTNVRDRNREAPPRAVAASVTDPGPGAHSLQPSSLVP